MAFSDAQLGMIVRHCQKLERFLEQHFGATGKGLHEKIGSVEDTLPQHLVRRLRRIATIRNNAVHNGEVSDLNFADFKAQCDEVMAELNKLRVRRVQGEVVHIPRPNMRESSVSMYEGNGKKMDSRTKKIQQESPIDSVLIRVCLGFCFSGIWTLLSWRSRSPESFWLPFFAISIILASFPSEEKSKAKSRVFKAFTWCAGVFVFWCVLSAYFAPGFAYLVEALLAIFILYLYLESPTYREDYVGFIVGACISFIVHFAFSNVDLDMLFQGLVVVLLIVFFLLVILIILITSI
jgi:hypothetical protein